MKVRSAIGLFVVLIISSCTQRISKDRLLLYSGLKIENSTNYGANYTDSFGVKYSLRYISATITNENEIPINIHLALSGEYDYPASHNNQKFKVFILSDDFTPDKITFDSKNYELGDNELRDFFERGLNSPYILDEVLRPNQNCVVVFGTLYPNPTDCGIVPNLLFAESNIDSFKSCENLKNIDHSINSQLGLKLNLNYCGDHCIQIPCGQISHLKN